MEMYIQYVDLNDGYLFFSSPLALQYEVVVYDPHSAELHRHIPERATVSSNIHIYMYNPRHVWGELASHKRSLTHCPSSQGWASRCPLLYTFLCLGHGWVGYLSFLSYFHTLASVLNTCISMYVNSLTSCTCIHVLVQHFEEKS